jgi:trigger factor
MTEATCKREIELEIPAEEVQKTAEKIARDWAKIARIPGFRPGKAPITLVRRRFAEDIQGEVMQSLMPEHLEKALTEKNLIPVTRPQVENVDFSEGGPLKFRASFEVLPEFELGNYKNLEIEVASPEIGDAQVKGAIEEMRQRAATFVPVEGRPAADGDYVVLKLTGTPQGGGEAVEADDVLCHVGGEETLAEFTENLRGVVAGEIRSFEAVYPADYPDPKLAGKTYTYNVEVRAIRAKSFPELNDEFAKDVAGAQAGVSTLAELRQKVREQLEAAKEQQQKASAREKLLETLVQRHEFPVPEALVEQQVNSRLERMIHSLSQQGVDPRAVNVDWVALRRRQRDRAVADVKAELLLDRIATAEKIEASDSELDEEIAKLAERSGESATALRARLTKQEALDRMKSKLRSDKTLDWLCRSARIQTTAGNEK